MLGCVGLRWAYGFGFGFAFPEWTQLLALAVFAHVIGDVSCSHGSRLLCLSALCPVGVSVTQFTAFRIVNSSYQLGIPLSCQTATGFLFPTRCTDRSRPLYDVVRGLTTLYVAASEIWLLFYLSCFFSLEKGCFFPEPLWHSPRNLTVW